MADMETRGLFSLGSVLLLVLFNYATAQETSIYFKVGGKLTLTPGTFSQELTSILWKNAGSLVADWVKDKVELTFYKTYKDRTQLDIKTGVLTIRDMRSEDAGLFTVEINSQVLGKSFRAEAVVDLEEPRVWITPLTCGSSVEPCSMTCETDTTQAGPITYTWKGGDQVLPQKTTMKVEITKAEMKRFKTFTCLVENPVSKNESEPEPNPLYEEPPPGEEDGGDGGNISGGVVGGVVVGVVIFLVLAGLAYWKRHVILKWLAEIFGHRWSPVSPDESPPNGNLDPPPSKNTEDVNIQMDPATDKTPDPSNKDDLSNNKPPEDSAPPQSSLDSAPPPVDSGPPPVDSGPPPEVSGPPPVDSGPPPEESAPPQSSVDASAP